ncbi:MULTISPECIES: hypothetical protein [Bacillus]|uniref:hypothetical protein n=1 Tax=Bacillus TaxID=1386 RepID=UPI000BB8366E|nr:MULTISPECIES: hypothetical protein [Bacillus]
MGPFDLTLAFLALALVGVAIVYTYMVGRRTDTQPSERDSEISEEVQKHYVLRNPVFIAMFVGTVLVLLYIAYAGMTTRW